MNLNHIFIIVFYIYLSMFQFQTQKIEKNFFGNELDICSTSPMTGYFRNGKCSTDQSDQGSHVVCAKVTKEFLDYTKQRGNDLSTSRGPSFPGLKPGDNWCLCALRWKEAYNAGKAPKVVLKATNNQVFKFVNKEDLLKEAINSNDTIENQQKLLNNDTNNTHDEL